MAKLTRKNGKCPTCCPNDPYAIYTLEPQWNEDGSWGQVWQCNNCGHTMPTNKAPLKSAKVLLDRCRQIRRWALEHHSSGFRPSEVKQLRVNRDHWDAGMLFLTIEVGYVGDERTLLSVVARDYRHICLDRYGKVELTNAKYKGRSRGIVNAASAPTK